jgi:poly-gamma-glutamate capsule biosynthesis protein CapA/YwtB (metallophosphatase superfamily)
MKRLGRRPFSHAGIFAVVLVLALGAQLAGSSAAWPQASDESPAAMVEVVARPAEEPVASALTMPAPAPILPVTFALGLDEDPAREPIERWMAQHWPDFAPRFVASLDGPPDVLVNHERPGEGLESIRLGATHWVALTHFASDVDDLPLDDLRAAFKGERSSWAELDGPNVPIAPVLVAGERALGAAALGIRPEEIGEVDVMSAKDFQERAPDLARHPGLLLLAPLALADVRFRALTVDGASPLLRRGPDSEYPLETARWLGIRRDRLHAEAGGHFRAGLLHFLSDELARSAPEVTTMTAAGDIIFGRKVDEKLVTYGDYTRPFHRVADELQRADLTVANLECTLTDRVLPPHDWNTFSFGSSTRAVEGLRFAGIDVVSLANNHSRDMGLGPFVEMLDVLRESDIAYVGAGRNLDEAHAPHVVELRGKRYAFLGYDEIGSAAYGATESTPGTAAMSEEAVRRDVAAARRVADVVIPFFHWGTEYTNRPTERQRRVAHAAVEAGAAMVLGSHAHWVQAFEFYEGAFIAYGLGNFVFDQDWSTETTQGVIMHASFVDGRLASVRFVPIQIEDLHQPRIVSRAAGRAILDRIFSVSAPAAPERWPSRVATVADAPAGPERVRVATGVDGANLRAEPDPSAPRVKAVPEGADLEVLGADREAAGRTWRNVRDPADGASGWIAADLLAPAR